MTDIESRLRAAMHAMLTEPRPAGLLDGVRRRHRRHLARVSASCAVAVLAIGVGAQPVAHALLTHPARAAVGGLARHRPAPAPTAAPGTELSGCDSSNVGAVGSNWRDGATRLAGHTLWFINGGMGTASGRPRGLKLEAGVMVIAGAKPGTTVVVEVAPHARGLLRFLYGRNDSVDAGTSYTMHSGENGVTFVSCRSGTGFAAEPRNVTIYYGAFLVRGDRCVPVDVWLPGRHTAVTTRLGDCGKRA